MNIINHGTLIDTYNYASLVRHQSKNGSSSYRVIGSRLSTYYKDQHKNFNRSYKYIQKKLIKKMAL